MLKFVVSDDGNEEILLKAGKSVSGVTPSPWESQVDHIVSNE
jgi:hypothetical protein